jgi:hypothetical protein
MSYPMGPSNPGGYGGGPGGPGGYGPPPPGGYGGGGYGPPGGGFGPGGGPPGGFGGPPPGFGGGGGDRMAAESKVKPAAITLMVFTVIGMLLQVVSFFMNVLGTGMGVANTANRGGDGGDAAAQLMSGAMGMVVNVVGLLAGGFCIFGLLKMMKLQSRGMALTAVILTMVPCLGSCWCVNLWVGIWALIVLNDDNVKASFTA